MDAGPPPKLTARLVSPAIHSVPSEAAATTVEDEGVIWKRLLQRATPCGEKRTKNVSTLGSVPTAPSPKSMG